MLPMRLAWNGRGAGFTIPIAMVLACGSFAGCESTGSSPTGDGPGGFGGDESGGGETGGTTGDGGSGTDTRGQKRSSHDPDVNVRQSLRDIAQQLAHVCAEDFAGDPGAREYDPRAPGPHRVIAITSDGQAHSWNEGLPDDWLPKSIEEVELVACVLPTEEWKKDTCDLLNAPDVDLYARTTEMTILSVHSGEREEETISSANPRRCPSVYTAPELYPDAPGPQEFMDKVLYRFVPLPECYDERPFYGCYQCSATESSAAFRCTDEVQASYSNQLLLPAVEVGDTVTLVLPEGFPDSESDSSSPPFDRESLYYYDWSQSDDVDTLPDDPRRSAEVVATEERRYRYLIAAKVPGFDGDPTLDRIELTFEAKVRRPLDEFFVLGTPRVGENIEVRARIDGTVNSKGCAWAIEQKPAGSELELLAGSESVELGIHDDIEPTSCTVSFRPDRPGDYVLASALHYTDIGYSEVFEGDVITVYDKPQVTPRNTALTYTIPGSVELEADLEHVAGTDRATWTVLSSPTGASVNFEENRAITAADVAYKFRGDLPGVYVLELVVEDRGGVSDSVIFEVTVLE